MGTQGYLGEFEQVVLLALVQLGERAPGGAVHEEIERRGRAPVALTAVYVTLSRMEDKGLVSSHRLDEPGTRARKAFTVEEPGLDALRRTRRQLDRFWDGIELEVEDA